MEYRRAQAEFHARGEAAWQEYLRTGVAHPADQVVGEMRERLEARRRQLRLPPAKAAKTLAAVELAAQAHLSRTPFIYRKAAQGNGLRRELIVPFGASGHVLLYEIAQPAKVVVIAARHQLEQDYH